MVNSMPSRPARFGIASGIVAEPETYNTLLNHFHTIWVKASPEEHMGRVRAQGDTRPMAGNPEAMDQLKTILRTREAYYGRAHAQLDTTGKTLDASEAELLDLIHTMGVFGQSQAAQIADHVST